MAKLTVNWTKEVVSSPVGLIYRVNTLCTNAVNFPSPAVLLVDKNGVYQNVCSLADYIYYLAHPSIWRFHLINRVPQLDSSYLGGDISIENTTITGMLRRYNTGKTILCVGSLSAAPPLNGTVIVSNGIRELRVPFSGTYEDAYYRMPGCYADFTDVETANKHVARQRERIISLLTAWERISGEFEAEISETLQNE